VDRAGQGDLFGGAPPKAPRGIGPARQPDELLALAARLPPSLRMGTCSWSYPGWEGLVYDTRASESLLAREGLPAYAAHPLLSTVSLDRAFYQPLTVADYARYAAQTPPTFRFTVKAWRALTDPELDGKPNPQFLSPAFAVETLARPMRDGLGTRAGVLLLQFSPGLLRRAQRPRAELLARTADVLDALRGLVRVAVEIRSPELLADDWFALLERGGAVHAPNLHPTMPPMAEQARAMPAGGFLFLRWMLRPGTRYQEASEGYDPYDRIVDVDVEARMQIATLCRDALARGQDVWLIADNKAEGSAVLSLAEIARVLA
jgi:uncharacterized protein YecE (DUF72 family)